jgi:hypothetical protein
MLDSTLARMFFCAAGIGVLAFGCQSERPVPRVPEGAEVAACSDSIQSSIALRVSVSPRELPTEFVTSEGVEKRYPFVGRKVLIAVTAYDAVNAQTTLHFVAQLGHADPLCRATVETSVQLVNREAARPPLWDLGTSYKDGVRKRWLAFYDPQTGPVRAIFTDPIAARGFAQWAQQTGATHVGRYQLGTFESEDPDSAIATVPTDRAIMGSYRAITAEERNLLKVGPLAER